MALSAPAGPGAQLQKAVALFRGMTVLDNVSWGGTRTCAPMCWTPCSTLAGRAREMALRADIEKNASSTFLKSTAYLIKSRLGGAASYASTVCVLMGYARWRSLLGV